MICINCGREISEGRLKILPDTRTCIGCSQVKPVIGFKVFSDKVTSDVVIINPENTEEIRRAENAYKYGWGDQDL